MNSNMVALAREAGVVGAGGAGFPTHVKLNSQADHIILNGAECEPLMTVDQTLLRDHAEIIVETLSELKSLYGAKHVSIAVKAKHREAVEAVEKALNRRRGEITLHKLEDFYPAGDEVILVYEVTQRQIPQSGIPLQVGVIVINVETIWNLSQAVRGYVNTHKLITVAGNVQKPGIYRVPLGVAVSSVLRVAGGFPGYNESVIEGGPMMGILLSDLEKPVVKTTKGLLVLPVNNPVPQNASRPLDNILRQAQAICCQCSLCADLCPRNLLGYHCVPNKTILAAGYAWTTGAEGLAQSLTCSECGACDQFACPMGLSPRRVNQMLKQKLGAMRVVDPEKGRIPIVNRWRPYRKISSEKLKLRLGLNSYASPTDTWNIKIEPDQVVLPLKQHVGVPARPIVKTGDVVSFGQLIGEIPENTEVSSRLFSSIEGVVTKVDAQTIIIKSEVK
jgi:Na+-translocating ferredoxin:NAD+ oxidoreductase RnfC subunit